MYIWHLNINGHIELHEDVIKLIPEFDFIEEKLLKYIIFYADYRRSPIRSFPDFQRDRIAKLKAGYLETENLLERDAVRAFINEYTSLIYDEDLEMRGIFQEKIEVLKKEIKSPDISFKDLKEKRDMSRYFEQEIARIDLKISAESYEEKPDIKGGKSLSYIELWQRRRKKYKEMVNTHG